MASDIWWNKFVRDFLYLIYRSNLEVPG
jgi:hypothetical protein